MGKIMKKPLFIMTTILVMLCLIYSYTNVEAKSPDDYTVKVVDFEGGDESETTEGSDQSSQDSAKTFVAGEGAGRGIVSRYWSAYLYGNSAGRT